MKSSFPRRSDESTYHETKLKDNKGSTSVTFYKDVIHVESSFVSCKEYMMKSKDLITKGSAVS